MKKICLTGGGTAGHVIPNLALIPFFRDYEIHYIGSSGMEKDLTKSLPIIYHEIECVKLIRSFTPKNLLIPQKLIHSVSAAKKVLEQIKPDVIFSKGGFVGLPVSMACKGRIPLILHESDMTLGLANKLAYKHCRLLLTSFDCIKKPKAKCTGSPLRQNIYSGDSFRAKAMCKMRDDSKPYLLVFGGSLGATALNDAVRRDLPALTQKYNVIHITGKGNLSGIKNENYFETEFTENMADFFALCDVAVARGGANSLFELMALGIPTLCIPLPKGSSRGDQIDNAEYFASKGCLISVHQENLIKFSLSEQVARVWKEQKSLRENMRKLNCIDGTREIASIIKTYAG